MLALCGTRITLGYALGILLLATAGAFAQANPAGSGADKQFDFERDFSSQLPEFGGSQPSGGKEAEFSAFIVPKSAGSPAMLAVHAKMAPKWHVYSVTQPDGGPTRTEIILDKSAQFRLLNSFQPTNPPKVRELDIWPGLPIEEHLGQVTWVAPIEIAEGVDPATLKITGKLDGQVCHDRDGCIPFSFLDTSFTAQLGTPEQLASLSAASHEVPTATDEAAPAAIGEFTPPDGNPVIRGHIEPQIAAPGSTTRLLLTVAPDDGWHVYPRADEVPTIGSRPTLIVLTKTSGLTPKAPVADTAVIDAKGQQYHQGPTTWTIEFPIAPGTQPGAYKVEGILGYQVCSDNTCLPPSGVKFRGVIEVGGQVASGSAELGFDASEYMAAAGSLANGVPWEGAASAQTATPSGNPLNLAALPLMILFSLIGGLILNLMPCVLPVIGLKILSFAQQAGESRAKIFALNVWYSLGLLAVFLALATLAVSLNLGWGEQFTATWFNVAMCALVFAMALSFLGVWEIPIPGFVGGEAAGKLESQEGIAGAFFKGVLTTVLATPCSGPFLGPVFGFTLKQPWFVTYIIFASIGLGMALPYLVIGAFPALMRLIPRPGAWMDTFKQLMGFVLLGTLVFLFSFMNKDYLVATFAMLIGIWLACWWVGRTPLTASETRQRMAWLGGLAVALSVTVFAFTALVPRETKIPWQPYSPAALAQAQAAGKTVMVDFTADWCLTCKMNLKWAINTDDVHQKIEQHDVVPLLADWTNRSTEIKDALAKLESRSIPLLAIYPAGQPDDPIVLRDVLSEGQVLKALDQAGPSKTQDTSEGAPRTAMMPPS